MLVQRGPVTILNSGSSLQQEEGEAPEISRIVDNLIGKREKSEKCIICLLACFNCRFIFSGVKVCT